MKTRIITIEKPWGKYVGRKNYVKNTLLPQLLSLGLDCEISPAVTPRDVIKGAHDFVTYKGCNFRYNNGSAENFLSNYNIWKECLEINESILILEDDVQLILVNEFNTMNAIREWESYADESSDILYLLSSVPYLQGRLKDYPHAEPLKGRGLVLVEHSWRDFAGTAAYAVSPESALSLTMLCEDIGIGPTDQFLQAAINRRLVNCIIPRDYQNCFTLHPELYWG